jgi:radical SAM superfamily enzyme YgiQ (UPF0313 family)
MKGMSVGFLFINVNHEVGYEFSESIPISTGYIAANLKAKGYDGVILDDVKDRPLTLNSLEKWIRIVDPDVIGFTVYQSTINRIRFLCRYIKSRHRRIVVILGGPQAMLMPSAALEELEDVDVLVRGEGELVVPELVESLEVGAPLDTVGGITCRCTGRIVDTGHAPEPPEDLDEYPSPYLSGVINLEGKETAILLSSRGCRHVCWFCITPRVCGGKIRYHSVDRTADEMEFLDDLGITRFWFADPNFTENHERTTRLLKEKIRRGIETQFWCQTRSDLIDADIMRLLKQAGADTIAFGLESGSPGILQRTNKGIELDQLKANIELAHSLEMKTELFSIFGLPGETVEDARQTLEFVRSLDIPIESNSGSQQMQLYFGSIYEKNPAKHGFKEIEGYRPRYYSIGDSFVTDTLSKGELRKVRNMWSLANEQMKMDVFYKQRTFEILDFLLENREDLEDDPTFYAYGAMSAAVIEEFNLLEQFLEGYAAIRSEHDADLDELVSSINIFSQTLEPAGPTDRIIFDARSWIDGVPFTSVSGKYWDVFLGRGLLLPSFEKGFLGVTQGDETTFTFAFPEDYGQEELSGREVEVQAKIRRVFKPMKAHTIEEIKTFNIRNTYDFKDLDLLKENNEILYYLALRDTPREALVKAPGHFLMFVLRLAKLGKLEEVRELSGLLKGRPKAINALGEALIAAGKSSWALEFFESIATSEYASVIKRVRCLLSMDRPGEAFKLLQSVPEAPELEYQETLLECLKASGNNMERIPSLEHHILDLRVAVALERHSVAGAGVAGVPPLVHGYDEDDYDD